MSCFVAAPDDTTTMEDAVAGTVPVEIIADVVLEADTLALINSYSNSNNNRYQMDVILSREGTALPYKFNAIGAKIGVI